MLFEDFFYFQLWQPCCSGEQNDLPNFGKGEYLCEIILNLGHAVVQEEMSFKHLFL